MKVLATQGDFDSFLKEAGDALVVIDFYATWCGPCKRIAPTLEKWDEEYKEQVKFAKVDVDENDETAQKCGISAMPTFHLYKKCEKVAEIVGADESKLKAKIDELK